MSAVPPHTDLEADKPLVQKRSASVVHWIFFILVWLVGAGACVLSVFWLWFPTIWGIAAANGWQLWSNWVRLCGGGVVFLAGVFALIVMAVVSIGPGAVIAAGILFLLGCIALGVTFVMDLIDLLTLGCTTGSFTCGEPWPYLLTLIFEGFAFVFGIAVAIMLFVLSGRRKNVAAVAKPVKVKVGKSKDTVKEQEAKASLDAPVEAPGGDSQEVISARKELSSVKPYLGLSLRDSEGEEGVKISAVKDDGPAQAAGLKVGDDILEVDGVDCDDNDEFKMIMKEAAPGEELPFLIERGSKKMPITVRFGATGLSLERVVELRRLAGEEFCKKLDESGAKRVKEVREKRKVEAAEQKAKSKAASASGSGTGTGTSPTTPKRQDSKKAMRRQASKGDQLKGMGRQPSRKSLDEERRRKEEAAKKKKEAAAQQREEQDAAEAATVSDADIEAAQKKLSAMKSSLGLALKDGPARGALISRVKVGHAAERGGLMKGDIVLAVGDVIVDDNDDFKMVMREAAPGEEEVFVVKRGDEELKLPVRFGGSGGIFFTALMELRELAGAEFCAKIDGAGADAIRVQKAKKAEKVSDKDRAAAQKKLQALKSALGCGVQDGPKRGARVGGVKPGSAAERAGLQTGDVIMDVEGEEVNSMDDFKLVCQMAAPGETVEFSILREEDEHVINVTFGANDASLSLEDVLELRRVAGVEFCRKMDLERGK